MKTLKATAIAVALFLCLPSGLAVADDRPGPAFTPGAAGIGDDYFPLDGNGGYDVAHYDIDVRYNPDTDVLRGLVTISAKATQNLSSFNLDLVGMNVRSIKVNGVAARFTRDGDELTVIPRRGLVNGRRFEVVVRYDGIPEPVVDSFGVSGFLATDDGTLVVGEPHVAATWYPVNDHPLDTASYRFDLTVPAGLEAVANGVLAGKRTAKGWTAWTWIAREPMASYLTTMTVGEFELRAYRQNGIRFWDALDVDLWDPVVVPRSGEQMALSQKAEATYKRLLRTISVPTDDDTTLSFWVDRDTEASWDYFFVEVHTVGLDDWTTLPEASGITSQDTGFVCPFWLGLHPFLAHYQTPTDGPDVSCTPSGSTGEWNAVSGSSGGYEQWHIDLSAYAGTDIEVSLTYASDDVMQENGVVIDDIDVPGPEGDTGFEADGDVMDGWTVPGAPEGSMPNENDWIVGTSADGPPPIGVNVDASLSRQSEIIEFLAGYFGPYPFSAGGAIVDDYENLGFALENQTRPIYAKEIFQDPINGDFVIVHEYAHQWYGNDLPLAGWKHIWLNEGFATYAEWLWAEREGLATVDEIFSFFASIFPPDDPFWSLPIGDPGPDSLFDGAVYVRGAMTLHALRLEVGDDNFFEILETWAASRAGENVSTPEFIELSERISGQQLDNLFDEWLFQPSMPGLPSIDEFAVVSQGAVSAPSVARIQLQRWEVTRR